MTEHDFTLELRKFLHKEKYNIRREVPNMGQSVDILASRGRWLTAVEAKLTDWKRALGQCRAHELVADYICIAIATTKVADELEVQIRERGYGLIHFDKDSKKCDWAIKPQRNSRVWPAQRRRFASHLREIEYG